MSSKRRVRDSQCTGKTRFLTRDAAEAMATKMASRPVFPGERVGRYHAYACTFCRQFHFGHLPAARKHRPGKKFKG